MRAFAGSARKHFLIESSRSSDALLASFQSAHRKMEAAIADLDAIIAVEAPDMSELCAARLRLSQANLARQQISRQVCDQIIERIAAGNAEAVRDLQRREQEQIQLTSLLVRTWSLKDVQRNWAGYRDASLVVREQLRAIVDAERRILYPLLAEKKLRGPADR
jgi:hypothetical protein